MRARAGTCALVLAAACSSGDDPVTLHWHGWVDSSSGAVTVLNPDQPLFADQMAITPMWRVDLSRDSAHDWVDPADVAQRDGMIAVLDRGAPYVGLFDSSGRKVSGFGRTGPGPGEMEQPFYLKLLDGQVLVGDGGQGMLTRFTDDGGFIDAHALPPLVADIVPLDSATILVRGIGGKPPRWSALSNGVARPWGILDSTDVLADEALACSKASGAKAELFLASCTVPTIVQVSDGTVKAVFRIERAAATPSVDQLEAFEKHVRARLSTAPLLPEQLEPLVARVLATNQVRKDIHGIAVDSASGLMALWSQLPVEFGADSASLDLFSSEGIYLARLPLPEPAVDVSLSGGVVAMIVNDSVSGAPGLTVLRLELPADLQELLEEAAPTLMAER